MNSRVGMMVIVVSSTKCSEKGVGLWGVKVHPLIGLTSKLAKVYLG